MSKANPTKPNIITQIIFLCILVVLLFIGGCYAHISVNREHTTNKRKIRINKTINIDLGKRNKNLLDTIN